MAIRPIFQGYLSVVSTHESSTSSSIMMFCARLSGSSRSLMLSYLFPEPQKGHPWYPKGLRVPYHYRFCRPQEWFQNRSVTFVNSFVRPFAIGRADELRKKSLKIKQHEHLHRAPLYGCIRPNHTCLGIRNESKSTIFDFKYLCTFSSPCCPKYCRRA